MNRTRGLMLGLALSCAVTAAHGQGSAADIQQAAEEKAVNLCSTCHGPRGISTSPEFPILAAQRKEYLEAQIDAFRKQTRSEKDAHDFMWGIAGNLDAAIIGGIASYYSSQPRAPSRTDDPALVAKGKELFDKGVQGRGIPACATCHGATGEGMAGFPRLAGQHAKYVAKQLAYIQSLVRAAPVMHGIVKDLTPAEMQAVAAYVQSKERNLGKSSSAVADTGAFDPSDEQQVASIREPLDKMDKATAVPIPSYYGFLTPGYKYVEYATGEKELYLASDPYELTNTASGLTSNTAAALSAYVNSFVGCTTQFCRMAESVPPPALGKMEPRQPDDEKCGIVECSPGKSIFAMGEHFRVRDPGQGSVAGCPQSCV